MTEEPSFVAHIRANPLDEAPRLILAFNELGDEGARELASVAWPSLLQLYLGCNRIGFGGAAALAALAGLRALSLPLKPLRPEGVSHLARADALSQLEELDLAAAGIASDGVLALARSRGLPSLRRLNVRANRIDASALRELARICPWNLTWLDLRSNAGHEVTQELRARFGEALVL